MELNTCDMSKAMIKAMQVVWVVDCKTLRVTAQCNNPRNRMHYQELNNTNKLVQGSANNVAQWKHVGNQESGIDPQGPSLVTSGWALRLGCSTTKETEQDE